MERRRDSAELGKQEPTPQPRPEAGLLRGLCKEHRRRKETSKIDHWESSGTRELKWRSRVADKPQRTLAAETAYPLLCRQRERRQRLIARVRSSVASIVHYLRDLANK